MVQYRICFHSTLNDKRSKIEFDHQKHEASHHLLPCLHGRSALFIRSRCVKDKTGDSLEQLLDARCLLAAGWLIRRTAVRLRLGARLSEHGRHTAIPHSGRIRHSLATATGAIPQFTAAPGAIRTTSNRSAIPTIEQRIRQQQRTATTRRHMP